MHPGRFPLAALVLLLAPAVALADLSKLDPTARISLQRLRLGESPATLAGEGRLSVGPLGELDVFVVGEVTREQLEAAGARVRTAVPGVFTAWIPADRVEEVAAIAGVSRIEGAQIDEVTNDLGAISTLAPSYRGPGPAFTGVNGAGVIIGGVDTGVDYDHEDFMNPDGTTRILKIWDQTSIAGSPPAGFGYGSEWNAAQIDARVATAGDTQGHGTHTMGTAAGNGSATGPGSAPAFTYAGMAPLADIIVVDGSALGSFSRTQMADAVNYIFGQATAFGKSCVINMSIGSQSGPKDGTDPFEQTLDALSGPGKIVVLSAGNDRGAPVHAEWFPGDPDPTMLISNASSAARYVAIRGYYEATEQHDVTITTPDGTVVGPVPLGGRSGVYPGPLTGNGNVYIENGLSLTSTGDKLVYIELNAANGATISGTWTFTYTPVVIGGAAGEVDMWRVATNMSISNFVVGNQPTEEVISALATGFSTIAAGAFVSRQNWMDCAGGGVTFGQPSAGNLTTFSSPGPTRDHRVKPDVTGPGTAILSSKSGDIGVSCSSPDVDLPGLRHAANQGTSMSAPHVTGAIALLFQKYGPLTPAQVQAQLHDRALVDGFVTAFGPVPNKDFGWGKLSLGDLSDPVCAVTGPNGAEVLVEGTTANLTWSASDLYLGVTGVDVELSRDHGATWTTLATGIANTGSLAWSVTGPPTTTALLRVTARDAAGNQGIDESDAVWEIAPSPVSVGVARFRAEPVEDGVRIAWEFADPSRFESITIERGARAEGPWDPLALETSFEGTATVATDRTAATGETYYYRLVVVAWAGGQEVLGPLPVTAGRPITEFALRRIAPNPTRRGATVEYAVPAASDVTVVLYDLQGREVAVLAEGRHSPGLHEVTWSGDGDRGPVRTGVYFVRLRAPGVTRSQRIVVTR